VTPKQRRLVETALTPRKFTSRQSKFIREYIKGLNGVRAAKLAGYAPGGDDKVAGVEAARLLANPRVYQEVQRRITKLSERDEISAERVLRETRALAYSDVSHYEVDDLGKIVLAPGAPPNAMAAIQSIKRRVTTDKDGNITREVEIKLWDKPGMVKLAGRYAAIKGFSDRLEVTGKDGGPITVAAMTVEQARAEIAALEAEAEKAIEAKVIDTTTVEPERKDPT
jgi:phage terminase small subunit